MTNHTEKRQGGIENEGLVKKIASMLNDWEEGDELASVCAKKILEEIRAHQQAS